MDENQFLKRSKEFIESEDGHSDEAQYENAVSLHIIVIFYNILA